jgi:hypothetical protein
MLRHLKFHLRSFQNFLLEAQPELRLSIQTTSRPSAERWIDLVLRWELGAARLPLLEFE